MKPRDISPRNTEHWQPTLILNLLLPCCFLLLCGLVASLTPCTDFLCIAVIRNVYYTALCYPLCAVWVNGYLYRKYRSGVSVFLIFLFALLFLCMLAYLFLWLLA